MSVSRQLSTTTTDAAKALLTMACCLLLGCNKGDGLTRSIVSGSVTLRGQPVQDGQIRFIPQGDTQGPLTIESIKDGQYRCARVGGVPVGTHRVEILAFHPDDPEPTGPGERPRRQLVPNRFNRDSELTVTISSSSGDVVQDFALTD